jgi:hypothetical protein
MLNQKGVTFVEILAVAFIFLLIAAAFFAIMDRKIEEAFTQVEQYNEQALKNAAVRYVLFNRFVPNVDADTMMLYMWAKDGYPSLEAELGFADSLNWPELRRKEVLGIQIEREVVQDKEGGVSVRYRFDVIYWNG